MTREYVKHGILSVKTLFGRSKHITYAFYMFLVCTVSTIKNKFMCCYMLLNNAFEFVSLFGQVHPFSNELISCLWIHVLNVRNAASVQQLWQKSFRRWFCSKFISNGCNFHFLDSFKSHVTHPCKIWWDGNIPSCEIKYAWTKTFLFTKYT